VVAAARWLVRAAVQVRLREKVIVAPTVRAFAAWCGGSSALAGVSFCTLPFQCRLCCHRYYVPLLRTPGQHQQRLLLQHDVVLPACMGTYLLHYKLCLVHCPCSLRMQKSVQALQAPRNQLSQHLTSRDSQAIRAALHSTPDLKHLTLTPVTHAHSRHRVTSCRIDWLLEGLADVVDWPMDLRL
jgi:hypothetical protein